MVCSSHISVISFLVTLLAWLSFVFFRLAHLALQNVNKDHAIFLYFHNLVAKRDQKTKNQKWDERNIDLSFHYLDPNVCIKRMIWSLFVVYLWYIDIYFSFRKTTWDIYLWSGHEPAAEPLSKHLANMVSPNECW